MAGFGLDSTLLPGSLGGGGSGSDGGGGYADPNERGAVGAGACGIGIGGVAYGDAGRGPAAPRNCAS
jgi:hypothetical protein